MRLDTGLFPTGCESLHCSFFRPHIFWKILYIDDLILTASYLIYFIIIITNLDR